MNETVCVVGLGYVGIPMLNAILTSTFYKVIAYDISERKIAELQAGKLPESLTRYSSIFDFADRVDFTTEIPDDVEEFHAFIICVPTPLTMDGSPKLDYVENALKTISTHTTENTIVALESTVHPGCTREMYWKYFSNKDFKAKLAFSPEREDPGNSKYTIQNIPKLVSGIFPEHTSLISNFYSEFIEEVVPVSSTEVAELSKLLENTQRAVNISLMNELKQYTNAIGVDIFEVIDAASTKPFGFTKYNPGPGIGGHCIPIDPSYLHWAAKKKGYFLDFIEQATKVNARLPDHIEFILTKTAAMNSIVLKEEKAIFVGIAYKPDVDDLRTSPSLEIYNRLKSLFKHSILLDPMCSGQLEECFSDLEFANSSDYITFVLTDHSSIDYVKLEKVSKLIFDSRGRYSISEKVIRI